MRNFFFVRLFCSNLMRNFLVDRHNTFATGGSDGFVNIWDGFNKKRLCQVNDRTVPGRMNPIIISEHAFFSRLSSTSC